MTVLQNTLLSNDTPNANSAEIGTAINPTPVTHKYTDVMVALTLSTVSIDSNIGDSVSYFLHFSFFIFGEDYHFNGFV